MASAEETSAAKPNTAPPPSRSIRSTAFEMAEALREAKETRAPSLARTFAIAKPRPRLAPATMATLPFNPRSMTPPDCCASTLALYPAQRGLRNQARLRARECWHPQERPAAAEFPYGLTCRFLPEIQNA